MSFTTLINYSTKTSNYSLVSSDDVVQFNCAGASLTATLPDATLVIVGKRYQIRRAQDGVINNILTVNTVSSQTVDIRTSGSIKLQPSDYLICVSDGSNWQVVTLQETVECHYTGASTTYATSNTVVPYATKVRDTHSAYSAGTFLVPVAGDYIIMAQGNSTSFSSTATGNGIGGGIYRNGATSIAETYMVSQVTGTVSYVTIQAGIKTYFNAGDTINFQIFKDANASASISNTPYRAYLTISKVGN